MRLQAALSSWPLRQCFTISRGSKTSAEIITVILEDGPFQGRGECVPYARYGETPQRVLADIKAMATLFAQQDITPQQLQQLMPPGAARNAVDCALWDLLARRSGQPVWRLAGLSEPKPVLSAYTISLDSPDNMAAAAAKTGRPLLKLKLGGDGDAARLRAVRAAVPDARLIVDANEAWSEAELPHLMAAALHSGIELIEQPLPANADHPLASIPHPVPVCADESVHGAQDLGALAGLYDAVNIKLDKTGGLTGAIELTAAARRFDLAIMIGCMVGTSLAMAPAALLAPLADYVDLDAPLLIAEDRAHPLRYDGSLMHPPAPELWGNAPR